MDLIVDLLVSGGFYDIPVIVDRFRKGAIFIPTTTNLSARTIADTFFDHDQYKEASLHLDSSLTGTRASSKDFRILYALIIRSITEKLQHTMPSRTVQREE